MIDVLQVADWIAVLYLGRMAATVKRSDVNQTTLVELITTGRSGDMGFAPASATAGGTLA
jgi:D-xylose transport system ATP-binding protein